MQYTEQEQEVMDYLPLVHKVVRNIKVKNKDYEEEDLVSVGVIGLMDALERYDPSQKVPFKNYAYIRIKGSIIDEVRKTSYVPRSRMTKLNQYYKAKEDLEKELQRTPTENKICEKLGIGIKELKGIHETVSQLANVSLDEVLYTESDSYSTMMDLIEDTSTERTEETIVSKEQSSFLANAITQLTEQEQQILQLLYVEELKTTEIAYIYDLSKARISQIHGGALLKLRKIIEGGYLHD